MKFYHENERWKEAVGYSGKLLHLETSSFKGFKFVINIYPFFTSLGLFNFQLLTILDPKNVCFYF